MDALLAHLIAEDWLDLRAVLRLCLLSGLFTLAAVLAFPRNAPSRRALMLAAVISLSLLPWVLALLTGEWTIEVDALPAVTLATMLPNFLLWLWAVVAVWRLTLYLLRVRSELNQVSAHPRIESGSALDVTASLSEVLNMPQPILRLGNSACSTSLRGPTILLPPGWRDWDARTLQAVLAHELVHIHRRDDRWMILTELLVIIYWWMPWIKLLAARHLETMEESCDDAASELVGQPSSYAYALAEAAGIRNQYNDQLTGANPAVTSMHAHHLVGRVGRFAHTRFIELDTPGVYWCVIAILVTVTALTSVQPVMRQAVIVTPEALRLTQAQPVVDGAQTSSGEATYYAVVRDEIRILGVVDPDQRERLNTPAYAPPAIYPGDAIRRGIEGEVLVEYRVNQDGSVSQATVIKSEPGDLFAANALRAVRNTRYAPGYTTNVRVQAMRTPQSRPPTRVQKYFRFRMVKD